MSPADREVFEVAVDLATAIRFGDGTNESLTDRFKAAVETAKPDWSQSKSVPTELAAVLIEIYPAVVGSLGLYSADEREKIENLAAEVLEWILLALSS